MTLPKTKRVAPLPVLGALPRYEVLRPIRERRLTSDRVLLLHPQSGMWVMVRAEAGLAGRAFLDACEATGLADETLQQSPLFARLRQAGLIREQRPAGACQGGCSGSLGKLTTLILKLVGFCDLACDYCYDYHALT